MKTTRSLAQALTVSLILTLSLAAPPPGHAAPQAAKAELRGLLGRAQFSRAGGPFQAVVAGATFETGDVIQTAAGSAVALDLGAGVGTVRLTESTTLVIEKWWVAEHAYELNLFLRDGEMLGRVAHPTSPSRFQVKVNSGLGAIVEGQFRLDAKGYLVLLDGKAKYVQMPSGGEPTAHALNTPPAQYLPPVGGVRAAPAELVKEVNNQLRSKLPKR